MSSTIQFPQGPFVDLQTGNVTLEWFLWLQNPQFISVNLGVVVAVTSGGTGLASYTTGDILTASASTTLAAVNDVATGNALLSGGVGVIPAWGKVGLTTHVTGTLPVANGGTSLAALGTGVVTALAVNIGTAGAFLVNGGALGTPSSGVATNVTGLPLTTGVTGVLPAANGGADAYAAFTTTRTGWTDVGAPTVTGRYSLNGKTCFFEIKVVPATTVATVAGTSYCSLPVTAAGIGGDGSMQDLTALTAIGDCVIDAANSRVYVPAQVATGDTLIIAGWFEAS